MFPLSVPFGLLIAIQVGVMQLLVPSLRTLVLYFVTQNFASLQLQLCFESKLMVEGNADMITNVVFCNWTWFSSFWNHMTLIKGSCYVIGTDLGAALVDLETGAGSYFLRSKSDVFALQFHQSVKFSQFQAPRCIFI